jgi:hypothetical protein
MYVVPFYHDIDVVAVQRGLLSAVVTTYFA